MKSTEAAVSQKPSVYTNRAWSPIEGLLALFILATAASIVFPIFGMVAIFVISAFHRNQKVLLIGTLLCVSLVITCASQKVPAGDLGNFLAWYAEAADYTFAEYIARQGREPLYHTIAYSLYFAFQGSEYVFIFSFALMIYGLLAVSATKMLYQLQPEGQLFLAIIYIQLLFPPLFNIGTQMLRQNLAASLFFFSLAFFRERREWLFWLLGFGCVSVHTSALILVVVAALIRILTTANRLTLLTVFSAGLLIFVYGVRLVLPEILSWLGREDSYLVQRISVPKFHDLGAVPLATYFIATFFLVAYSIAPRSNNAFEILLRISACMAIVPLLLGWDPIFSQLVIRLSMYQYFLIWVPLYIFSKTIPVGPIFTKTLALFSIPWFGMNLFSSIWEYQNSGYALIFGPFSLLANQ